jgi:hypothetical protein
MKKLLITAAVVLAALLLTWSVYKNPSVPVTEPENSGNTEGITSPAAAEADPAPDRKTRAERLESLYQAPVAVSENINRIIEPSGKFADRLRLVNALPRNLSFNDRKALYRFLKFGANNKDNYVLKNDILNALRNQQPLTPELTDVMLDLFYDKSQDIVVRSYALQHLRPWYLDEQQHDEVIRQAFYDGLKETDTEIAGVALLALRYLAEQAPEFDKPFIAEQAAAIATDENSYILTRISAVGVAGKMNTAEQLPAIRELTASGNPVTLRVAAIAAVGELGTLADLDSLEQTAAGKKPYSTAASAAIKKIISKYKNNQ